MLRPDAALGDNFWAPEVAYCDGTFYLYYSVGHKDKHHQLRIATSIEPLGPYQDVGEALVDLKTVRLRSIPARFRTMTVSGISSMPQIF